MRETPTRRFLHLAIRDPYSPLTYETQVNCRNTNILATYFFTSATVIQIATTYRLSPQAIYAIIHDTLNSVWLHSSPHLKSLYPIASLPTSKPRRDTPLPPPHLTLTDSLTIALGTAYENHEIDALLAQVTLGLYHRLTTSTPPILTSLRRIATQAGRHLFAPQVHQFAQALRQADIPVSRLVHPASKGNYHFTLERFTPDARRVLSTHPELSHPTPTSPAISQISGEPQTIPSINQLISSKSYRPLGRLLYQLGIHHNSSQTDFTSLTTPIFVYQRKYSNYYYPTDLESQLITELTRNH